MDKQIQLLIDTVNNYKPGDLVSAIQIAELCNKILKNHELSDKQKDTIYTVEKEFNNLISNKTAFLDTTKVAQLQKMLSTLFKNAQDTTKPQEKHLVTIKPKEIEILKSFIGESFDHLDGIEENILKLEVNFNNELVNAVFRPFHTIKGSASYFGFKRLTSLSHSLETLLDMLRQHEIEIDSEIVDVLLNGVDMANNILFQTQEILSKYEANEKQEALKIDESNFNVDQLIHKIETLIEERKKAQQQNVSSYDNLSNELMKDFEVETEEKLNTIEEKLIGLESNTKQFELYDDIFRALHTLKGNSGLLLSTISNENQKKLNPVYYIKDIAHRAESIIQKRRDKKEELSENEIELLLNFLDILKALLDNFINKENISSELKSTIEETLKNTENKTDISQFEKTPTSSAYTNILNQSIEAIHSGIVDLQKGKLDNQSISKMERAFNNLTRLGERVKYNLLINHAKEGINILNILKKDKNGSQAVSKLTALIEKIESKGDRRKSGNNIITKPLAGKYEDKTSQVLKVDEKRIDSLLKQVMELAVNNNNLKEIEKDFKLSSTTKNLIDDLHSVITNISKTTEELQNTVMQIRLLPLNTVFSRFHRLTRDLSKNLGKKVQLVISGEDTELDKTVIDLIGDPLIHIIRNSIDHGIEYPEERLAKGKPEMGTITISAYNLGQNVIIDIKDDGKGIDVEKIKSKAIEKNLINKEQIQEMDKNSLLSLIFLPGFSTAANVSDISGRGVGMDVVKTNIEKIGGNIDIKTEKNVGTTVSLKIPLSLAISRGLEVEIDNEHYYLPLEYVLETVKIPINKIKSFKDRKMVVIREELYELKALAEIVNSRKVSDKDNQEIANLVILSANGRKMALKVDKFYGEGEYMMRPLPKLVEDIDLFSGVTITGKGRILLIIDPLKLF